VAFDPADKDHRRWYYEFLENRGWGTCPVRFICPNDNGLDLTLMIRDHLAKWYVDKEFEPKTVVQKKKKTVDIKPKR
jgi:hypothetical protein